MIEKLVDNGYNISFLILFVIVVLLRLFYAFIVYLNGKRRYLDNPIYWSVFSAVFGLPAFVMFFALNAGQGVKAPVKKAHKVTFSVLLVFILCLSCAFVPLRAYECSQEYSALSNSEVYKINPVKYVVYDKKGKAYNTMLLEISNISDWFIDGSNYREVPVYYDDGTECADECCMINSDGYAVRNFKESDYENRIYDNDDLYIDFYIDDDGNFYYNRYDCSWDKDGNLIIVGLNEELTRDNTVLYDDYAADDEMNGFHNYSYYDSIDDSDDSY